MANGSAGSGGLEQSAGKRLRSRKAIEQAYGEFKESAPEARTLAWVLGRRDTIQGDN